MFARQTKRRYQGALTSKAGKTSTYYANHEENWSQYPFEGNISSRR